MKKFRLILLALIVILFGGCMADADVEDPDPDPDPIESPSMYDTVSYSFKDLTFYIIQEEDILYDTHDIVLEFSLVYESIMNESLSEEESYIYGSLLTVLQELSIASSTSYEDVLEMTVQEFKDECDAQDITITTTNVIVFDQFKGLLEDLRTTGSISRRYIEKELYLTAFLARTLSSNELDALEHLQIINSDLYNTYDETIDFSTISFEDFMAIVTLHTEYTVTPVEADLEIAYNILQEIQ